jgi:hypothetical protein
MRKSQFFAALILVGLIACNDSGSRVNDVPAAEVKSADAQQPHMHSVDTSNLQDTGLPSIPEGARVFFVNLKDGQTVKSPFTVEMGAEGIAVDTAGSIKPASGHHHILINAGEFMEAGTVIPMDSTHRHFGNAQKEATLTLPPGKHRLTLQFADGIHRSYGSALAASIEVTVE